MFALMTAGAAALGPACRGLELAADWRGAIQSHFQFTPAPVVMAGPQASPSFPILVAGTDPSTVELAPVEVRARPIYGELKADFTLQEAAAKDAEIRKNMGIGFRGVRAGPVAIGVVTVFDLPVMILGGLSW